MIGTTALLAAAADLAPALKPGHGQLDIGLVATPDLIGGGLRLDHRFTPWLSAYALGELGYSVAARRLEAIGAAGARFTW